MKRREQRSKRTEKRFPETTIVRAVESAQELEVALEERVGGPGAPEIRADGDAHRSGLEPPPPDGDPEAARRAVGGDHDRRAKREPIAVPPRGEIGRAHV